MATLFDLYGIGDVEAVPAPLGKRSWGSAFADTGRAVASGVGGLIKSGGTLYGLATGDMDNAATQLGDTTQQYWTEGYSPQLKAKIEARRQAIDAADGTGAKAWTAIKETLTDPALATETAASNVATLVPGAVLGRAATAAKFAAGMRAAQAAGPVSLATQQAIGKGAATLGTGVAIGTGAVQQGGDVSGDVYQSAMQQPDSVWAKNPDFIAAVRSAVDNGVDVDSAIQALKHQFSLSAARATMAPATGISLVANALPGARALEQALIGGAARETIKNGTRFGLLKSMAKGMLGEGAQEALEEGGGAYAGNLLQREYTDPNRDPWEGVGEAAGMGAAGGILLGSVGGAMHRRPLEQGGQVDLTAPTAPASTPSPAVAPEGTVNYEDPQFQEPMGPKQNMLGMPVVGYDGGNWANTEAPRSPDAGLDMPTAPNSGVQIDLFADQNPSQEFGPQPYARTDFGEAGPSVEAMRDPTLGRPMPQQSLAVPDSLTGDMLHANPTAMAPTAFNPMQEPGNPNQFQYNAADPTATQRPAAPTRGAVAGNIRSQLVQRTGIADGFATKMSIELAGLVGDANAVASYLQAEEQKQTKELEKLNRKVDQGSDQLTPEEYQAKRDAIEQRQMTIMAAQELMQEHLRQSISPMVDEGVGKAQPGLTMATPELGNDTEQRMRKQNAKRQSAEFAASVSSATAEVDRRAAERQAEDTKQARLALIRDTLGKPTRGQPVARVREALRKAGYTNLDLSPAEQEEVQRITQKRSDVRAATVVPPGLAAARGRLTSRESLDTTEEAKPEQKLEAPKQEKKVETVSKQPAAPVVSPKPEASAGQSTKPAATSNTTEKPAAPKVATENRKADGNKPAPVDSPKPVVAAKPTEQAPVEMTPEEKKKLSKMRDAVSKYEKLLVCLRS